MGNDVSGEDGRAEGVGDLRKEEGEPVEALGLRLLGEALVHVRPLLVLALGWGWASRSVAFLRRHIRTLNIVGGGVLVLLGILMVTGLWTALMSALQQVVINVPLPL